ncbi:glutamyl-tRNA reductase [Candidatus Sumerlaeota bacterium]|nr:glutamyl-tRNA reductase [Candidatus Sumerlaeota bacterium]
MSQTMTAAEPSVGEAHVRSKAPVLSAISIDHRSAPIALRERLTLPTARRRALIEWLRGHQGSEEVVALSTCLRTEVVAVGGGDLAQALAEVSGVPMEEFSAALTVWDSPRAVAERMFRVAAGMESVALGETQIVGQIREAYQAATDLGAIGPVLSQLIERAIAVGREVRTQTSIGEGIVSIPSLATHMARHALGSLKGRRGVIVGTGTMAHLSARHLTAAGLDLVFVSQSSVERAQSLADEFGASAAAFSSDLDFAQGADLLICATRTDEPLIDAESLASQSDGSRATPLLLIDLCVPRAIAPSAGELPGCRLINLDSMRGKCAAAKRRREEASAEAQPLIAQAVHEFESWRSARMVGPFIQLLLSRLEDLRAAEVERVSSRLNGDRTHVDQLTRSIMKKVANGAIQQLRRAAAAGEAERAIADLQGVFQFGGAHGRRGRG